MNKIIGVIFLWGCIFVSLTGCAKAEAGLTAGEGTYQPATSPEVTALTNRNAGKHTLIVFAAASLTGAFQEIAGSYEASHPGVSIRLNFAGSQILRTQLEQGAIADVFASADHKNMDALVEEELVDQSGFQDFATNRLVVILPGNNPGNLRDLTGLARPGIKIVLADQSVPVGNYARQILEKLSQDPLYGEGFISQVLANVVSNETDVKQVVTKVELGEADAGIVYSSDGVAAPELGTISIPEKYNVVARYPIAIPISANEPELAADFIAYITSPEGQAILEQWGFGEMPR